MCQPSVTRSVQQLEHQAKTALFIRHPRGLILTKQGEMLFERVKNMMTEFKQAKNEISGVAEDTSGTLKVTTTYAYASTVLCQHICAFSKLYSDIKIDLICDDIDLDLTKREADVSIRSFNIHASDLEQIFLYERKLQLFASKEYLEVIGTPTTLEDLDTHKFIIFNVPFTTTQNIQNVNWILALSTMSSQQREPSIRVNSVECLAQMAEAGLGIIGLSNDSFLIKQHKLIRVLPMVEGPIAKMHYTYPKSIKNLKIANLFGTYLKRVFRNEPYL